VRACVCVSFISFAYFTFAFEYFANKYIIRFIIARYHKKSHCISRSYSAASIRYIVSFSVKNVRARFCLKNKSFLFARRKKRNKTIKFHESIKSPELGIKNREMEMVERRDQFMKQVLIIMSWILILGRNVDSEYI